MNAYTVTDQTEDVTEYFANWADALDTRLWWTSDPDNRRHIISLEWHRPGHEPLLMRSNDMPSDYWKYPASPDA